MECPPEIAEVLLRILTTGLLRIRAHGWDDNPQRCAVEADHLHNLPSLLASFSLDRLEYYWETERVSYMKQSAPEDMLVFVPLWDCLAALMTRTTEVAGRHT